MAGGTQLIRDWCCKIFWLVIRKYKCNFAELRRGCLARTTQRLRQKLHIYENLISKGLNTKLQAQKVSLNRSLAAKSAASEAKGKHGDDKSS